jgi:hypothetical protein
MGKVAEQERRAARIGNTGKRLDELGAFPMASLRVGMGRPSFGGQSIHRIDCFSASPLRRSTDGTASLFAARLPSGSPHANDKLQKSSGQTLTDTVA